MTRASVTDGFNLPEGESSEVWLDRDTLLLLSALGPGMATRSGLARTIRLWRRGSDPLTASLVFETSERGPVGQRGPGYANMLTRYPRRFGALFCTMPVIDMRRYAKLLTGPAITHEQRSG
jgi:prolyl oligopeptidase PreP (S9A serine peptidase family)